MTSRNDAVILQYFDGETTFLDAQEAHMRQFGELLMTSRMEAMEKELDKMYFLDNDRYARKLQEMTEEYRRSPVRISSHAGLSFSEDPEELARQLDGFFEEAKGIGAEHPEVRGRLRGIVAPHIDLRAGGRCYTYPYDELRERSQADTFVILGINHRSHGAPFTLTAKTFETPLGPVESDEEFCKGLAKDYPGDLSAEELNHRTEHSVEFQIIFLQHVLKERKKPFKIVPVICADFPEAMLQKESPIEVSAEVKAFVQNLQDQLEARDDGACVIASVDLTHYGQRFGDRETLSDALLGSLERADRRMLEFAEKGDPEGFFMMNAEEGGIRKVDAVPAVYVALKALPNAKARLLSYMQAPEAATQSVVTFCSMAIEEEE